MNEEFQKILEESFKGYKEYHSTALIIFAIVLAFIQGLQSLFFSRKLNRFKSELKKSEIKFSKYNNLQIEALSKLYHLLADFQGFTIVLENTINSYKREFGTTTYEWVKSFNICQREFAREKYILPKKIKVQSESLFDDFIDLAKYIKIKKDLNNMISIVDDEPEYQGYDDDYYNHILKEITNYKDADLFKIAHSRINGIKEDIEKIFEEME